MPKIKVVLLIVAAAIGNFSMLAQNAKSHASSSGSPSGTSSLTSTKPLTPKSAMPTHRKTAVTLPRTKNVNTGAQLTQLERGNVKAGSLKSSTTPVKQPPLKSSNVPIEKNSGIDFKYQKPKTTAGTKGPNPNDATK